MRDFEIRKILLKSELSRYVADECSKVVEELVIPAAKARIDIAVINGHFHGYEIKSASDTLQRLPNQIEAYIKVFDFLSIVTEEKYHDRILDLIPSWVGMYVCCEKKNQVKQVRPPVENSQRDGFHIAKLLWKEELISALQLNNITFRKNARNWVLAEMLSANLDIDVLSSTVRDCLKKRKKWKVIA